MRYLLFIAGSMCIVSAQATAAVPDSTQLARTSSSGYTHPHSGATVPSEVVGQLLSAIKTFDEQELDVGVVYADATNTELTTVYFYRNVTGSVPVWFDRAQWAIESSDRLGRPGVASVGAFTPPGLAPSSGLRAAYSLEGGDFRSTAVAITLAGDWYVKVRVSSAKLEPPALLQRLDAFFAAVRWPEPPVAPAVAPIADCATGLPAHADAQPVDDEQQFAAALVGSTVRLVSEELAAKVGAPKDGAAPEGDFCRGELVEPSGNVYRLNESTDSYLLALGDGGRGLWVGRSAIAGLGDLATDANFNVEFQDMGKATGYGSFKTLPPPSQARKLFDSNEPTYSASTWGKQNEITIHTADE